MKLIKKIGLIHNAHPHENLLLSSFFLKRYLRSLNEYVAFSKAVKISSETHVPNWSNKSDNTPSPWTYLIPWSNYKKIDPPYELNFRNGIDPKTGVKQGWLLQSMKAISDEQTEKIKKLIGV